MEESKMRPYRSIYFNDERKWKRTQLLDDVLQVGKQKAIGYVCATVKGEKNPTDGAWSIKYLRTLAKQLKQEGKFVCIMPPSESLYCQTLWVGDPIMMQEIINKNIKLLTKNKWPTTAEQVFDLMCYIDVDHDDSKALYHFITDLFNSWCLGCEKPIWKDEEDKPYSQFPYDPKIREKR